MGFKQKRRESKSGDARPAAVASATPTRASAPSPSLSSLIPNSRLVMLMAFFALRFSALIASDEPAVTTSAGTPLLVVRQDRVFAPALLNTLLRAAHDRGAGSIELNSVGATDALRSTESDFAFLAPFLDAAREPGANAFVLSVHIAQPLAQPLAQALPSSAEEDLRDAESASAERPEPPLEPALLVHPSIRGRGGLVAHSISFLALQVPAGGSGGVLELWRASNETARGPLGAPDERVALLPNQLVSFRGDARHRLVTVGARSTTNTRATDAAARAGALVLLALEQYRADAGAYEQLEPIRAAKGMEDESRRFVKQQAHVVAQTVGRLSGIVTYVAIGAGILAAVCGVI